MSEVAEAPKAPQPPKSEHVLTPEQREEIRGKAKEGAKAVGKRLLYRKIAMKEDADLTGSERALKKFISIKNETETTGQQDEPQSLDIPLEGKPLIAHAKVNGQQRDVKITKIVGSVTRDGVANAKCMYEYSEGEGTFNDGGVPAEIPWENVIAGQIVSEQETFVGEFQGEDKTMFQYYASQLADGEKAKVMDDELFSDDALEKTREAIQKSATSTGILTRSNVESFIESQMPKVAEGENPTAEKQAQISQLETVRTNLDGATIITPDILQKIITNDTDIDEASVTEGLASVEKDAAQAFQKLEEIQKELDKKPLPNEETRLKEQQSQLQTSYDALMQQRDVLQTLREVTRLFEGSNMQGLTEQYWKMLENGEISEEMAKKLGEGFNNGNMDEILGALVEPKKQKNESQDEFEKRQKRYLKIQELKKRTKNFGLLTIIAVFALGTSFTQELKK